MPGGHNENTKLLGFFADKELLGKVDEACKGLVRSQFLREAAVEYIIARGVDVPEHLKHPPSRAGKGGPKKKLLKYPSLIKPKPDASSKSASPAVELLDEAEKPEPGPVPKRKRKP